MLLFRAVMWSPPDNYLINRYKDNTVKDLKKALKILKSTNGDPDEIKYVSHILRAKLRPKRNQSSESCPDNSHSNTQVLNHDKYIVKKFWDYVKNVLNKKDCALPSFNMVQCFSYFTKTWLLFIPINCLKFRAGFPCYLSLKFSLTLTLHHINTSLP